MSKKIISKIESSKFFDAEWYLDRYPDVRMSGIDPAKHYFKYGGVLRRDPGPNFSSGFYYDMNHGLERKGTNPLTHFLTRKTLTPVDEKKVMWAAAKLAERGDSDKAILKAMENLSKKKHDVINILKANNSLEESSEEKWLFYLNEYLESLGSAPIELKVSSGDLLDRLAVSDLTTIESGPMVSILMAAWNSEKTIRSAAESILNQTWGNLELIIVDDASDDATWDILLSLSKSDSRVKILKNKKNVGPYVSKNIALAYSKGSYITGQDSDDWSHPERIEKQTLYLESTKQAACLSGMLRVQHDGKIVSINKVGPNTKDGVCRAAFISMMACKQFILDRVGFWDNVRFGGDSELIKRIEKITGRDIKKLHTVTMLCLDNPSGLTNHPVFGHSQESGVSNIRIKYRDSFNKWHKKLNGEISRLELVHDPRKFPVPDEATNKIDVVNEVILEHEIKSGPLYNKHINVDVCVITNLRFPGGNASSTLDEINYLSSLGLSVSLIHCPVDTNLGKKISERYSSRREIITNWSAVGAINCKYLIVRHPAVVSSCSFSRLKEKIFSKKSFFVVNNSMYRPNGDAVYDINDYIGEVISLNSSETYICPISPVIRKEIEPALNNKKLSHVLSNSNWSPTFNLKDYDLQPKEIMSIPFSIGRHGRDGEEKWLEDAEKLLLVYPSSKSDFSISILGGASNAEKILGYLPGNWGVKTFGSISPIEYLSDLDVFVYFPNTGLSEAFGRTIVEAMFAGVPCVLPKKFKDVFGELAIYCEPEDVSYVINRLSQKNTERVKYLLEVKRIALDFYSSSITSERLGLNVAIKEEDDFIRTISEDSLSFKSWIECK